jgi:hypothetical protein
MGAPAERGHGGVCPTRGADTALPLLGWAKGREAGAKSENFRTIFFGAQICAKSHETVEKVMGTSYLGRK